ncbi:transcriptional repressor DicA [mine drainage metagenome]|uniref:Transcriptional repressor DicA n=1 Tax=mine drainage metagenome TaxID=410659 RepID=A0A1J5T413_9ZZZZ
MSDSLITLNPHSQARLNHARSFCMYIQNMSTGKRLRELRERNKLNQETVGEYCGVSKGMVSQWENDIVLPPIERMMELRKKIYFKLDWLYCEDGEFRPDIEALLKVAQPLPVYAVTKLTKEGLSYAELIKSAHEDNNGTQ